MGVKRSHPGALRDIIALNVRRIRTEKGLTQDALADLCELDRTYVGSIERGQRNLTIDSLERLSNGLGVEPWQLVRRTIVER
ncbi:MULTISPECIES: helix-turn-helix domain-containing protein [unclassified Methylobacterium]|uniref:helix-turn-helix domain-containing protein n=1 Tax=unclassified Methylobacterium TaxID=2615210 RepID=UPI0036F87B46